MSLRLFADHCVPTSIISILRQAGHELFVLRDHLPKNSPDELVIAKAQDLNAILLSLNGDFADIVRYPPKQFGGIIAAQIHDHPEVIPPTMQRLSEYFARFPDANHYAGKLFLVEPHRIRVKV
jgi:hypothetical protein